MLRYIMEEYRVTHPEFNDFIINEGSDWKIVVEDIIDSGNTLFRLMPMLEERNPADICICTLLDKPDRREVDIDVKYNGFNIPDEFVVGYGLDYDQMYRNLPYIGVVHLDDEN